MHTDVCESCDGTAPKPLLRTVTLVVDGDRVDGQTLCPECFADWIQRYQTEMATTMPSSDSDADPDVGTDITIAEETEPAPDLGTGSSVFDRAVANAADGEDRASASDGSRNTEIREVGGKPPQGPGSTDEVDIDLGDDPE